MYIFYMDDSGENGLHIFSALGVEDKNWREVSNAIRNYRRALRRHAGIFMNKELHATKFMSGRGRPSDRHLDPALRRRVFQYTLKCLAKLGPEKLILFNVAVRNQQWAYERMLNRINRTMEARDSYAIIISDEGKEAEYTKLVRKMGAYNPIPSKFGTWDGGATGGKNIPISRVLEDPVFRNSESSYLIQAVDFCAYALLRKEKPLDRISGVSDDFALLEPICFKAANQNDPFGIVR
ncbi:DUF3800 domain-containing protein [Achromobacter xylosoxidans]|uniref:DUF3800 domain-containing protein n=1 Tax=Alcaligenes xylosoxydans xylosoxydans TaxID=85698 RepID=UPI00336AE855